MSAQGPPNVSPHAPHACQAMEMPMILFLVLLVLSRQVGGRTKAPVDHEAGKCLKTIKLENGDVIDCVDIYEQPAFDHPLLKNHTIQMRPSFIAEVKGEDFSSESFVRQTWLNSGSCSQGTIPILRVPNSNIGSESIKQRSGMISGNEPKPCKVEVAGVAANAQSPYDGVASQITVWDVLVEVTEWSVSSIAAGNDTTFIDAGWGVGQRLFGDNKPRLFASWRVGEQGCFNLMCPGFVQVSNKVMLGAELTPLSKYGGQQYVMFVKIYKDGNQGKWWLMFSNEAVGYWPMSILPQLGTAREVQWLGKVCNTASRGFHSVTQMGSGHFSCEGYAKSSSFAELRVLNKEGRDFHAPKDYEFTATFPECYDARKYDPRNGDIAFLYGGPGGPCCDGGCRCNV